MKNKGITLIALIVSIIILLILASVAIATLGGENGMISRAREAAEKTRMTAFQEELGLDVSTYLTEGYTAAEEVSLAGLKSYLEGTGKYVAEEGETGTLTIKKEIDEKEYEATVKADFSITVLGLAAPDESKIETDGTSYYIYNEKQMRTLASEVNSGNTFEGKTIYLMNDINLACTNENQWIPIGTETAKFKGTFEGNNHKISEIYIDSTFGFQGLFGYCEDAKLYNFGIESGMIRGFDSVAGIAGMLVNSNRDINNSLAIIENCYNKAVVMGENSCAGVAAKNSYGVIKNCYNVGLINGSGSGVGGIVGSSQSVKIDSCYNTAKVTVNGDNYIQAGGILGQGSLGIIMNSYNSGVVEAVSSSDWVEVGGIAGKAPREIKNCYNGVNATVKGTGADTVNGQIRAAGIAGTASSSSIIQDCYNRASIQSTNTVSSANSFAGGITAYCGDVINCYNTGTLSSIKSGGIATYLNSCSIENCYFLSGTSSAAVRRISLFYSKCDGENDGGYEECGVCDDFGRVGSLEDG